MEITYFYQRTIFWKSTMKCRSTESTCTPWTLIVPSRPSMLSVLQRILTYSYVYWTVHRCNSWRIKEPWRHLLFYFTAYVINMFRTLIYPSSGACDCAVELPHRSFCSLRHYSNPAAPNLQHTTNREQNDRCGNSTAQPQATDDGYINVRNMLST